VVIFGYMQNRWRLGLGLRFSSYKNLKEATIHPGAGLNPSGLDMRRFPRILVGDARLVGFCIPDGFRSVLQTLDCWAPEAELEFIAVQVRWASTDSARQVRTICCG
jgi:hypothetical protein